MVYYLIAIVLVLYSFIDFKKSLIVCLAFRMFLNTNVTLISIPGIPILTLDLALSVFFIISFFSKGNRYLNARCKFPYFVPFALLVFSWTISALFGVAGIKAEISVLFKNIVGNIIFIWMLWEIFETKEDFYKILKILTIVYFISGLYGLYEISSLSNPLTEYTQTLNHDPEKVVNWDYSQSGRGYRINSIFEHAIGAGLNWAMFVFFSIYILLKNEKIKISKIFFIITIALSVTCLFFTRSRTPLIFLGVSILSVFDFKRKRTYFFLILTLLFVAFVLPNIAPDTIVLLQSIFDKSLTATVGGSNTMLRMDQALASFQLLQKSPFFGLGMKFRNVYDGLLVYRLKGAESIWFTVIPCLGIIGVISYLILLFYSLYIIPNKYESRELFFVGLAYWLAVSASSTTGFHEFIYFLIIFYYIKRSKTYQQNHACVYGIYFKKFKIHYGKICKGEHNA